MCRLCYCNFINENNWWGGWWGWVGIEEKIGEGVRRGVIQETPSQCKTLGDYYRQNLREEGWYWPYGEPDTEEVILKVMVLFILCWGGGGRLMVGKE